MPERIGTKTYEFGAGTINWGRDACWAADEPVESSLTYRVIVRLKSLEVQPNRQT